MFAPTEQHTETAQQLAITIAEGKARASALDKELKVIKADIDAASQQLGELMVQNGQKSMKFENGLQPIVSQVTKNYKQPEAQWSKVQEFFEAMGITEIPLHWTSMNARANDLVEQGVDLPTELFNTSQVVSVRLNGQSKYLQSKN